MLRLADSDDVTQPSTSAIEHFAAEVGKLSGGSVRVRIIFSAAGQRIPRAEERTIGMVRAGTFDLGVVGARAWDLVGENAFQALHAPFLITSTTLLDRVLESPIADKMLASLEQENVVGLALVPDHLRRPFGIGRAFVSLRDFAGARIRIQPSRATAALMRALGAIPIEVSNDQIGVQIAKGHVDGEELSLFNDPGSSTPTGNIVFFGKALTFFANEGAFRRLTRSQRRDVFTAAANTRRWVAQHSPSELELGPSVCTDRRRIVLARTADVRAIGHASRPVYALLERDPATKRYIERIEAMKATMAPTPPVRVAPACSRVVPSPTAAGREQPPSVLNGTYRWVLTAADAHAAGQTGDTYPIIGTASLHDGTWSFAGADHDGGTYTIHGNRVRFEWPRVASVLVFEYTRDRDGTIHLRPVPPMDAGDEFVWAYEPWRRIGPPSDVSG